MKILKFVAVAFLAFLISSCLTVEKKKYKFEITGKNSGKLTITYVNIFSQMDDSTDVSEQDFDELINDYINGEKLKESFPMASEVQQRLYEENGQLNGEVTMNFASLEAVRLYQMNKKSPVCFNVGQTIDSESFESTNGTYGNSDYMNVVFWSPKTKVFELTTTVNEFSDEDCVSLVKQYRRWK
ncbi:MAG: hypothetical protein A2W93_07360 [Bacteroidetes bacterium GWF2_43_63]|nr:MAG: hypothetical protein A2W94_15430 [Bacteroidetes bacterium GWE2_42_42]OFY54045.1 MAG: hypothetical protein A2W93_07360 [Bacteroidetes bacterium GWF2_43_63]HCB63545.1 hypothetical protein [Bacteroidales bacterium]HCY23209.1 hypothetical protein [Bacteroidales bacterium]